MILKCNYHLISEDEDEDFSKGAEEFVEAARKRRIERKGGEGTLQNVCYNWLDSRSLKLLFNYLFLLLILMSCHHKRQKKCSLIHWFEAK